MLASKGRVPMTMRTHPVDRRLWFVSLAMIVAIVAVGMIVSGPRPHLGSPGVVRLAAAAVVTPRGAPAHFLPRPPAPAPDGGGGGPLRPRGLTPPGYPARAF